MTVRPSPFLAEVDAPEASYADVGQRPEEIVVLVPTTGSDEATRAKTRLWAMIRAVERLADSIGPESFDRDLFIAPLPALSRLLGFTKRNRRDLEDDSI